MTADQVAGAPGKSVLLMPAVFVICAVAMFFGLQGPIGIITGFVLLFYLPGVATILAFDLREGSREDHVFIPLLISPVVVSLVSLALYSATGSMHLSVRLTVVLFLVLFIVLFLVRRNYPFGREHRIPKEIYLISILFCLLMIVSFVVNRHLLVRSDAYYHASLIFEIQERGMPPMDPRLPDIALKYYWMYHFFLYGWKELTGIPVFWAMFSFMLVNAFSFPYLVARLTLVFTSDRAKLIFTPLFAIAGLSAASWILWPVALLRIPFGDVRGGDELQRILQKVEFDSHKVIYTLTPIRTLLVNVLNKFYTQTSFTYSISLFLLCSISAIDAVFRKKGTVSFFLWMTLLFAGTFVFQIIAGAALIMMAVGSAILLFMFYRLREGKSAPIASTLVLPGAAILAAILVLPYVRSLGSAGEGNVVAQFLHIGQANFFTVVAPLVVLLPFSLRAVRKLFTTEATEWRMIGAWIVSLFVVNVFLDTGGTSEIKLAFLLLQLLLPFIAWELIGSIRRSSGRRLILLSVWIAVLFAVPTVLTVRGFVMDKPQDAIEEHKYCLSEEDRELTDWIRGNTDTHAVIMEHDFYSIMPVYARRREFYSTDAAMTTFGYDDAKTRRYRGLYEKFFSGEPITDADIEYLRGLPFDIFIVIWDIDENVHPAAAAQFASAPERFETVFENEAGTVYRLVE